LKISSVLEENKVSVDRHSHLDREESYVRCLGKGGVLPIDKACPRTYQSYINIFLKIGGGGGRAKFFF